jgi:2-hydroxychromene-2-carboxylate isomerase
MARDSPGDKFDVQFHFDPICPYAWITSRWVVQVAALKQYRVDWRFISLRLINADKDYDKDFPAGYEHVHTAGLRLLRVAAAVRESLGGQAVGEFYTAAGSSIFDREPQTDPDRTWMGSAEHVLEVLDLAGLPRELAPAAEENQFDAMIQAESDAALSKTGRDVGTPIIVFQPPEGPAFFGPVISRVPHDDEAVALWDSVIHLATFPGFAELKRSLRERPQLRALGAEVTTAPVQEDWKGGSRRS